MPAADASEPLTHHRGLDLTGKFTLRLPNEIMEGFAATRPEAAAHTFIDYLADRSGPRRTYTWAQWNQWSRALAHRLTQVAGKADRVAILAPQGPEYVVSFHACLRAGVIAVPLFQPDMPGHGERVEQVFDDCRPSVVITTRDKAEQVDKLIAARGLSDTVRVVFPEDVAGEAGAADSAAFVPPADLTLDDLAYLQYTSGSTRAPAGTALTHRNLVFNLFQIIQAHGMADLVPDATGVSWLPLFHDMGLLLGACATAIVGAHGVVMDPIAFILRPTRWITELAAHPNVLTAAPNFAYGLAVKKTGPDLLETLDLSGVVAMVNGAEPVSAQTVERFEAHFAPAGLPPTAQRPSYGLAEATLFVTVGDPAAPRRVVQADVQALQQARLVDNPEAGTRLISSGFATGNDVLVVDEATGRPLAEGGVGEIWVNSPSVGRGYWNRPQETEATFGGRLAPEDAAALGVPEGPWLRTGDLGALLGRDLFVTGRSKDLIIVDGRNLYPHDVEYSVQNAHEGIALHKLAAFSVPVAGGGEGVVVVAEQYRDMPDAGARLDEIAAAAKGRVSQEHVVALHDFVLIATGSIPWTSSGKIARKATRAAYLAGTLNRVPPPA